MRLEWHMQQNQQLRCTSHTIKLALIYFCSKNVHPAAARGETSSSCSHQRALCWWELHVTWEYIYAPLLRLAADVYYMCCCDLVYSAVCVCVCVVHMWCMHAHILSLLHLNVSSSHYAGARLLARKLVWKHERMSIEALEKEECSIGDSCVINTCFNIQENIFYL